MDVRLRADLCEWLVALIATHDRQRVFRLHYGSHLAHQLTRAKLGYLGLPCRCGHLSAGARRLTAAPTHLIRRRVRREVADVKHRPTARCRPNARGAKAKPPGGGSLGGFSLQGVGGRGHTPEQQ
jgi:hypothetical protein